MHGQGVLKDSANKVIKTGEWDKGTFIREI